MNAKQKMMGYAESKMTEEQKQNMSVEAWCGKMATEGIVFERSNVVKFAKATRDGKTIVITETTRRQVVDGEIEETEEVMRIEL